MTIRERVLRWAIRKYLSTQGNQKIIEILWSECRTRFYEDNVHTRANLLKEHIDREVQYELHINAKRYSP